MWAICVRLLRTDKGCGALGSEDQPHHRSSTTPSPTHFFLITFPPHTISYFADHTALPLIPGLRAHSSPGIGGVPLHNPCRYPTLRTPTESPNLNKGEERGACWQIQPFAFHTSCGQPRTSCRTCASNSESITGEYSNQRKCVSTKFADLVLKTIAVCCSLSLGV